jgi:hypothetical protein
MGLPVVKSSLENPMDLYKDRANAFSRPAVDSLLLMLFFTCFHLRGEMLIKGLPFVKTKTGMRSDIELIRMAEEAWHPLVNRFYQEALFRGKIMGFFLELND